MEGHVFTTRGYLPAAQVEMRASVVEDDDDKKVTRTDKFDKTDGEWVGNDLHVEMKRMPAMFGETGRFNRISG